MVVISNGFFKFHLSVAAAEASRRGTLSSFLTGAYPTPTLRRVLELPILRTSAKAQRLMARRDGIPDTLVKALFTSEALFVVGAAAQNETAVLNSYKHYGRLAISHVQRAASEGARLYHYRAGYGGRSVEVAKEYGMLTLCDHSIAHPGVIDAMIENAGEMPVRNRRENLRLINDYLLQDIEQADAVVVNSDFVKDTFRAAGHDRSSVHVVYWGVDDAFMEQVPMKRTQREKPSLLFAGNFQKRKGAITIVESLQMLGRTAWQMEIAGNVDSEIETHYTSFFTDPRVTCCGQLSRSALAAAMSRNDIFIFPSLAEGSARVIFEAMACGCYIITTPNSGSIVEDGVHGRVVPPGDTERLAEAIEEAFGNPSRTAAVGQQNAKCIGQNYRQDRYGNNLHALYMELLSGKSRQTKLPETSKVESMKSPA